MEDRITKMLSIIRNEPGIRPKDINQLLKLKHSGHLRNELSKQKLVRKVKKGGAVHYYQQ